MVGQARAFDIAVQHSAGSNLKITGYLSRNLVKNASEEEVYDEQYVMNILIEQAQLNAKHGRFFADQSHPTRDEKKV